MSRSPAAILSILFVLATASVAAPAAPGSDVSSAGPLRVPGTEVLTLPEASNGIVYELYLHVPEACRSAGDDCPVVYMLDAEYSFALAAQIVTHLADRDRIRPVISVAVAYPDKSRYRYTRSRDYTPWFEADAGYGRAHQRESGGGPAFLRALRDDVVPRVEARLPGAGRERTLVGHSYGGLFATFAWLEAPDLFRRFVIVSPSLWYGGGRLLERARSACAGAPVDTRAELYLAVGSFEEQPGNGRAMVTDLQALAAIAERCGGRASAVALRVLDEETHASVFPAALSHGLRWHFGGS